MQIILVQHCQSGHHVNGLTGGWTDTPLTEKGRMQAEAVAAQLSGAFAQEEAALYTSDLKRAFETAAFIGRALGTELISKACLREIDNGVAAWQSRDWARAHRNPDHGRPFDPDYLEFENGETWRRFNARIAACMEEIRERAKRTSIVVTHGCALSSVLKWWFGLGPDQMASTHFAARPGSITIIEENGFAQRTMKLFNDVGHLAHLQVK